MDHPVHIVVLERDEAVAAFIASQLPKEYECRFVATAEAAEALIDTRVPDLFLCADDLDDESGLMFLARTRDKWTTLRRILMVPDPDGDLFFTALKEIPGLSYLSKPLEKRAFHRIVRHVLWEPPSDEVQESDLIENTSAAPSQKNDRAITSTTVVLLETNPAEAARLITLLPWGFRHKIATNPEQAEALLDAEPADLFLCADDLADESGLMFIARTRDKWPSTKRILMVPEADPEFFFYASREMPVLSYLGKPVKKQELLHILRHGLQQPQILDDLEEEPAQDEPSLLSRSFIRMGTWAIVILIGATIVVTVLLIIYQIKCKFGTELLPE